MKRILFGAICLFVGATISARVAMADAERQPVDEAVHLCTGHAPGYVVALEFGTGAGPLLVDARCTAVAGTLTALTFEKALSPADPAGLPIRVDAIAPRISASAAPLRRRHGAPPARRTS